MFVFRFFSLGCYLFLSGSRTKLIWWSLSMFIALFVGSFILATFIPLSFLHPHQHSPPHKLPVSLSWLFGFALWSTGLIQGHSCGVRCKPLQWQVSNSPVALSPKNCLPPAATGCCWFSWWDRDNWALYPLWMRESSLAPAPREKP